MLVIAIFVGNITIKPFTTAILQRFGFRTVLITAAGVSGIGLALCASFTAGTPLALIVLVLVVGGVFRSIGFTAYNTIVFADVAPEGDGQREHPVEHDPAADDGSWRRHRVPSRYEPAHRSIISSASPAQVGDRLRRRFCCSRSWLSSRRARPRCSLLRRVRRSSWQRRAARSRNHRLPATSRHRGRDAPVSHNGDTVVGRAFVRRRGERSSSPALALAAAPVPGRGHGTFVSLFARWQPLDELAALRPHGHARRAVPRVR